MGHFRLTTTIIVSAFLLLFFSPNAIQGQYTEVINSNRPGISVSAYALGKGVIQAEMGFGYEQRDHSGLDYVSDLIGVDLALRYGLLFEKLELYYEGSYVKQDIAYETLAFEESRSDFSRNRLGLKFLLYDPYKNPERNKPNLYSWRANNVFQLRDLVPAVSIYGGATFNLGDNPFYVGDPIASPRVMIATQSSLGSRLVLISNIAYDRITTDFPEWNYSISLSHAFKNPKWSVFAEHQGIQSDRYSDVLLRGGIAHLFNENFQADLNLGASFKNTPSRIFGSLGFSYRLDYHKDPPVKAIDEQRGGQNGQIGRKAMRKKGSDSFGLSKKERRKRKKKEKEIDW